jgi:hypothetical protein
MAHFEDVTKKASVSGEIMIISSARRVHFGLSSENAATSIEVRWLSGVLQTLIDVHADQILKLEEPD